MIIQLLVMLNTHVNLKHELTLDTFTSSQFCTHATHSKQIVQNVITKQKLM